MCMWEIYFYDAVTVIWSKKQTMNKQNKLILAQDNTVYMLCVTLHMFKGCAVLLLHHLVNDIGTVFEPTYEFQITQPTLHYTWLLEYNQLILLSSIRRTDS